MQDQSTRHRTGTDPRHQLRLAWKNFLLVLFSVVGIVSVGYGIVTGDMAVMAVGVALVAMAEATDAKLRIYALEEREREAVRNAG